MQKIVSIPYRGRVNWLLTWARNEAQLWWTTALFQWNSHKENEKYFRFETFFAAVATLARLPTHTCATYAHTRSSPRPHVSNERRARGAAEHANRPTRSMYSYYYERRNAFCRARTKFVVPLLLPIIKIATHFCALKFAPPPIDVAFPSVFRALLD